MDKFTESEPSSRSSNSTFYSNDQQGKRGIDDRSANQSQSRESEFERKGFSKSDPSGRIFDDAYDSPDGTGYGARSSVAQSNDHSSTPVTTDGANSSKKTGTGEFNINDWTMPADLNQAINERIVGSLALKVFPRIDTNADGFLSQGELAAAASNPKFKGNDAIAVKVLNDCLPEIEIVSNDEFGFENDGPTRADITKFFKDMSTFEDQTSLAYRLKTVGAKIFDDIDTNKDGYLKPAELQAYNAPDDGNPWNTIEKDLSVETMIRMFDDIKSASNDEFGYESQITKKDLDKYFGVVCDRYDVGAFLKAEKSLDDARLNQSK